MSDLNVLEQNLTDEINAAADETSLEAVRLSALGKEGVVSKQLQTLGKMSIEERKQMGPVLNGLKTRITKAIDDKKRQLEEEAFEARLASEAIDVTLPIRPEATGKIHPITQVREELVRLVAPLGFDLIDSAPGEGAALAAPVAALKGRTAPTRLMLFNQNFDEDKKDGFTGHLLEGGIVEKAIHMGHLNGFFKKIVSAFLGLPIAPMRMRPDFYPVTEPSAVVELSYAQTGGLLKVGEGDLWAPVAGGGMLRPWVLADNGLNPSEVQACVWRFSLDRLAMLKYGIGEQKEIYTADAGWLAHYGFEPLAQPNLVTGSN